MTYATASRSHRGARHDDPGIAHPAAARHRRGSARASRWTTTRSKTIPDYSAELARAQAATDLRDRRATRKILRTFVPETVEFKTGKRIRPVAPFLEVFAVTDDDALVPLTLELLTRHGLDEKAISWRAVVANRKVVRRTGQPAGPGAGRYRVVRRPQAAASQGPLRQLHLEASLHRLRPGALHPADRPSFPRSGCASRRPRA